jgi:type II secretory pathway predicted ATPase ExeA
LSLTLALRAVRHPATGAALLRVAWRFRRRGWWRRPPFLPLPAVDYLRWRMHTAYGEYEAVPPADDVIRYARWAVREP